MVDKRASQIPASIKCTVARDNSAALASCNCVSPMPGKRDVLGKMQLHPPGAQIKLCRKRNRFSRSSFTLYACHHQSRGMPLRKTLVFNPYIFDRNSIGEVILLNFPDGSITN
jgi:hypothetical protein